ncbi:hypothetical protein MHLP_02235 [Candidatus Mycoplasma haematolamae str. Purdue]|uniref:Uncharacterized protein n=1 Tax=Mycoplasma haematolamae (strain Purdue) TaxID=1212765 RepID=I7C6A6_MYCHA|nr:hypothetical protein [Candidatus Mycoplasma haematolamae]AFO52027.1 hypothetical protein MHLP_02235 [Candidatus Mycoplasma haematolamae str. Purdue]
MGAQAASGDNKIDDVGWFQHSDFGSHLQGIFEEHPGLKSFVESVIADFKGRGCEYKDHAETGSWWYEVICKQGEPTGRKNVSQ